MVLGQEVCYAAFRELWHLIKYGIDILYRCVKKKQALLIHGNMLIYHDEAQTHQCQLFLEQLAQVSEHQPDSEEIHLVERTTKIAMHEAMVAELGLVEDLEDILSYPTFTRTW
jgi:hypothetical protein